MADAKKQNKQLSIELPEEVAEGTYSNLAVIAHSEQCEPFVQLLLDHGLRVERKAISDKLGKE